jgi:hypothetical protein
LTALPSYCGSRVERRGRHVGNDRSGQFGPVIVIETSRVIHVIPLEARDELVRYLRRPPARSRHRPSGRASSHAKLEGMLNGQAIAIDRHDARALLAAFQFWSVSEAGYPDTVALNARPQAIARNAAA